MRLPTIHLNGTDPQTLLDAYTAAHEAVRAATTALDAIPVNARDYYPQGDRAAFDAYREHSERIRHLAALAEELHQVISHIDAEMDARKTACVRRSKPEE